LQVRARLSGVRRTVCIILFRNTPQGVPERPNRVQAQGSIAIATASPQPAVSVPDTVTATDIKLAAAYYPILVDLAGQKQSLTCSELLHRAKTTHRGNTAVQKAIVVSTGRRLDIVRRFTELHGYPDLSSLVMDKGFGESGRDAPLRKGDPRKDHDQVFAFDWNSVAAEFQGFVKVTTKAIVPRKAVKSAAALELMAAHYTEHRKALPANVRERRESILELLMEGLAPDAAFSEALRDT